MQKKCNDKKSINDELIDRINKIENENKDKTNQFGLKDYIFTGIVIISCLLLIIIGKNL